MPALQNLILSPPFLNGFRQIGRTRLTSPSAVITLSGLPRMKYLMFRLHLMQNGTLQPALRVNGDAGANYSYRRSDNGAADATSVTQTRIALRPAASAANMQGIIEILNHALMERIVTAWLSEAGAVGAGSIGGRSEIVGKWANTVDFVTELDVINLGAGLYDTDSEILALGKA